MTDTERQPDEQLRDITLKLADEAGHRALNEILAEADAAIQQLIDNAVSEARLDEIETAHKAWLTTSLVDHMNKRLAELRQLTTNPNGDKK